MFSYIYFCY
jgi:hypothetical protein